MPLVAPSQSWFARTNAVPPAAAALGYNTRNFFDDFNDPSTIDFNDTAATGFQWWPHNVWPNSTAYTDSVWRLSPPTPASALSVSKSILTIATDAGGFGQGLNTAVANGSTYRGRVFGNGFYSEIVASFDPAAQGTGAHPSFFTIGIGFLTGASANFGEMDFFEATQAGGSSVTTTNNKNYWVISGGNINNSGFAGPLTLTPIDFTQFHKYGFSWVPMSKNAGTGLMKFFIDDRHISSADFSYTSSSDFGNRVDTDQCPIIIGTGNNWPVKFDSVAIWQTSAGDMTVQA